MLTQQNYIKRIPASSFKAQKRGGKGIIGGTTKEEDEIKLIRYANNHDDLLYFTNQGRVFKLPVYEIPKTGRTAKGQAIVNILQLQENETVTAILNAHEKFTGEYLLMATVNGTVKKTAVSDFKNVRKSGLIAMKLRDNDSLEWVKQVSPGDEVVMVTQNGKCIRFNEDEARPMGRASIGVRGIRLKSGDKTVQMAVVNDKETAELLVIMENGLGKMTKVQDYRLQSRGGTGVKTANITAKTGKVVGAEVLTQDMAIDLIIISKSGQVIRMSTKHIPSQGRATQGVYLMRLRPSDKVASISSLVATDDEDEEETTDDKKDAKQATLVEDKKG